MHTGRGVILSFTLPVFCLPLLAVQIYYLNYETKRVVPPPACQHDWRRALFYKHNTACSKVRNCVHKLKKKAKLRQLYTPINMTGRHE